MRSLLVFVVLVFMSCGVYGATGYDAAEQQGLVAAVRSDGDMMHNRDVQQVRDFIKSEDAEFVTSISSLSDEEQLLLMRSWLAKRSFKFFYDKYMSELKSQSEKTGRKIKKKTYKSDAKAYTRTTIMYWLDRGKLDEKECEEDMLKRRACDYPDGFEEYEISYDKYEGLDGSEQNEELQINKDDVHANSSKFLHISLKVVNNDFGSEKFGNWMLSAGGQTEKYDEHHKWRNQEAADVRVGKYRKPTKEERAKVNTMFRKLAIVSDDSREWDSNWLPDAAVTEFTVDHDVSYRNYQ